MGSRVRIALAVLGTMVCGVPTVHGQVFVVGLKTATSDLTTEFHPTHVALPEQPLDERGRLDLIRNLEAEQGFAHRELPLGAGLTLLANGNMSPRDEAYKRMVYEKGQSAAPGDRIEISKLEFKGDRIVIDFNGGPYAKHRFLSHISLNDMPLAQQGPAATGCRVTLVFEGGVPEVTAAEVKALLDPVVDFKAKSSVEAYADTLPPKVREAIDEHEILVGMNRKMVLASVGQPKAKHREHVSNADDDSALYEEWIYGDPPQDTKFVRFQHDRVVRLEVAALGKPIQIFEHNDVGADHTPTLETRTILNGDTHRAEETGAAAGAAPTLRRPGEREEQTAAPGLGKVVVPKDTSTGAPKPTVTPPPAQNLTAMK